jgi:hypothetical protein
MTDKERIALDTIEHSVGSGVSIVPATTGISPESRRAILNLAAIVNNDFKTYPSLGSITSADFRRRAIRIIGLMRRKNI